MKLKKHLQFKDVIDEYINLLDEQIELPILIEKANEKFNQHLTHDVSNAHKPGETEDMFKSFLQIKKHEERKIELNDEITEAENTLKEFLALLKGGKVTYEKKDDNSKSKTTFLFWLDDNKIMSNR